MRATASLTPGRPGVMRAASYAILSWLLLVAGPDGISAEVPMNMAQSATPARLVILGASYAGSWGTPPLPGYEVVNRGVAGEQTSGMRARFQSDVISGGANTVLIWGHINNITQTDITGGSPAQIEAVKQATRDDYAAMLENARAAGIKVILATEVPMAAPTGLVNEARALLGSLLGKESYQAKVNVHVRDLNVFVRRLAARNHLRLLDFEKVFAPAGGGRKPEFASEDLSHISPAGYKALTTYAIGELSESQ